MVLAHLRCGHTFAQLAGGCGVGPATAHRYVTEAVNVLAAPAHGLLDALDTTGVICWADKAYQGAGHAVRVPYRRWDKLSAGHKAVNRAHAKLRALG